MRDHWISKGFTPVRLRRTGKLDAHRGATDQLSRNIALRLKAGSGLKRAAARPLPEEIAFLADFGVPQIVLRYAAALARRQGVSADAALIAEGLVDEEVFYRALADHLRVDFLPDQPEIAPPVDAAAAAELGYARLAKNPEGLLWLFAPQGKSLVRLMGAARVATARPRYAITTRKLFLSALRWEPLQKASAAAASCVETANPGLCARRALEGPALPVIFAANVALVGCLFAPSNALALGAALPLAALFLIAVLLRLFACAASFENVEPDCALTDAQLPVYTVIAPLYHEARVASQLARSIDRLDYPRAKLDVIFVLEQDDRATLEALRRFGPRTPHQILVAPYGAPRTKPRAMNIAASFARGALLVVFDAEDLPQSQQLRRAAALFACLPARVACLQASLCIDDGAQSWLAAFFALDYAALFDVFNKGLGEMGLPMFLGGTSNHFKVSILKKIGFWDAYNVTEDADLGLRLARAGYIVKTFASHTGEEAPVDVDAFLAQRSRWLKGWMQTAIVHCRDPLRLMRDLGLRRMLAVLGMFASGFVGPLLAPLLTTAFCYRAIFDDLLSPRTPAQIALSTLWCFLALSGAAAILWPLLLGMRRRGLTPFWPALLLLPLWQLLLSVAAWRALAELRDNPFLWRKTEHGLAPRVETAALY